ncbi:O-antigen ligase family protein [Patescibacteria group bacterium]|nr:O-antigen ligase family protein [Patescibacteria group bacterium]
MGEKQAIKGKLRLITGILCAVVLLYPFNQFYWNYGWEINIPYADLLVILLAIVSLAYFTKDAVGKKSFTISKQILLNLIPLLFLFITGALSLFNVWPEQLMVSVKYWWRFVGFYYIFYFLFIQFVASSERRFWKISWCLYSLGIFLSFMGLVSFIWPEIPQAFHMATPLSWFNLFPYGSSHNLLAESLVSIILFSWLLVYRYQEKEYSKLLYLGLAFMIGTVLLTFSRTGWLVLWIELFILAAIYYRYQFVSFIKKFWWIGIVILALLAIYFITFAQTNFVTSSNDARLAMIDKSWLLFLEHPWIGNGIGTWQEIVSKDIYYVYEFGQPLEQHGVLWKLIAEQGVLGVVVWFSMMAYFLYVLIKNYLRFSLTNPWRWGALIAIIVVVGQLIFQLLDTGYYSAKMWLPLGLAFALMYISQNYLNEQE